MQLPLPTMPPVELRGGVYHAPPLRDLEHEFLALRVFPLDHRGHVGIQVRLAPDRGPHDPPDWQFKAQLVIPTTYAALAVISGQLHDLAAGRCREIRIDAQALP